MHLPRLVVTAGLHRATAALAVSPDSVVLSSTFEIWMPEDRQAGNALELVAVLVGQGFGDGDALQHVDDAHHNGQLELLAKHVHGEEPAPGRRGQALHSTPASSPPRSRRERQPC